MIKPITLNQDNIVEILKDIIDDLNKVPPSSICQRCKNNDGEGMFVMIGDSEQWYQTVLCKECRDLLEK